jgi:hypothetical protein
VGTRTRELRRHPIGWRKRAALLPAELALDALTAGALAVGSVRSRSVVL